MAVPSYIGPDTDLLRRVVSGGSGEMSVHVRRVFDAPEHRGWSVSYCTRQVSGSARCLRGRLLSDSRGVWLSVNSEAAMLDRLNVDPPHRFADVVWCCGSMWY